MSKLFWQLLKAAPIALGTSIFLASASIAAPETNEVLDQIKEYNNEAQGASMGQVTNVFELRDVSPGDWAFEALRSLVERYGCIEGYPDKTYRGNRALSRYEFAAGLNACLNQIERLIAASEAVLREDIDKLQRLLEEFQQELTALGARVDDLEGRVAFLEDHQFSTTTKLKGEAIMSLNVAGTDFQASNRDLITRRAVQGETNPVLQNQRVLFGPDPALGNPNPVGTPLTVRRDVPEVEDEVTLSNRVRLELNSSFTGKDNLTTRLQSGSFDNLRNATGTYNARLGYADNTDNGVEVDKLLYRTPLGGDRFQAYLGAVGIALDDVFDVNNPYFESSGTGALSRFARFNPIVYRTSTEGGIATNIKFGEKFGVGLAYLTGATDRNGDLGPEDFRDGGGVFDGDYTAGIQINFDPSERLGISATYARSYYSGPELDNNGLFGRTGSDEAEIPFRRNAFINAAIPGVPGTAAGLVPGDAVATSVDRFGLQATFKVTDRFNVAGWFGAALARPEAPYFNLNGPGLFGPAPADNETDVILSAALNLALLDLLKEGSVLGLAFGVPPVNTDSTNSYVSILTGSSNDPTYFVEAQYRYPITDRILITPGAYVVINPNQNADNDTIVVGTLRTTFKF
jgi:Carbohydrate-selective porin, OprB family/S-layer homology domain